MKKRAANRFFFDKIWILFPLLVLSVACAPAAPPAMAPAAPQPVEPQPRQAGQAVFIAYAADTETLHMTLSDLGSGPPPKVASIEIGAEINYAFSPDRTLLAIVSKISGGADGGCAAACLRVFQLDGLAETARVDLPPMIYESDFVHQVVFDSQGTRVALLYTSQGKSRAAVVDLSRQPLERTPDSALPFSPRLIAFSASGGQIMLVGHPLPETGSANQNLNPLLQALLLDAQTLEVLWRQDLPDVKDGFYGAPDFNNFEESVYYASGMAADAVKQRVYIAHADADRLTVVDFAAQRQRTLEIREPQAILERLLDFALNLGVRPVQAKAGNSYVRGALLSADGGTLYLVGERTNLVRNNAGEWEAVSTHGGLQAWDTERGTRLLQAETTATEIRPGPAGLILLNGYDRERPGYRPFTELFDLASGQIRARLENTYAYLTPRADGRLALVSSFSDDRGVTQLATFDEQTQAVLHSWSDRRSYSFWPELR